MNPVIKGRYIEAYNAYKVRNELKALGFKWNKTNQVWVGTPTPDKLPAVYSLLDIEASSSVIRPSPMREHLREYQKRAVDFLHFAKFAYIGDKAGLGKTIETLCYLDEISKRFLIVCPASVVWNWREETKRWLGIEGIVVEGSKTKISESKAYFVSYDTFTRRVRDFMKIGIEVLVCDEAHYLKNPKAQRTKAVKLFADEVPLSSIVFLSGTPFLNYPIELFAQLNILYPMEFSNYFEFGKRYSGGRRGYWGWEFKQATNVDELKKRMSSFYIGRTKQEVLKELPPVEFIHLPIKNKLDEYRALVNKVRKQIQTGDKEKEIRANIFRLRRMVGLLKVPSIVELIEMISDRTVIFVVHLDILNVLSELYPKALTISGAMKLEERYEIVTRFNQGESDILIITQAMQEGINLQSAHHLIMGERLWNSAKEEQVYSRLHRFGQENSVSVWIPILTGTLDEKIHNLIKNKGDEYAKIFNIDAIPVKEFLDYL